MGLTMLALSGVTAASASAVAPEIVNSAGNQLVKKAFTGTLGSGLMVQAGGGLNEFCLNGTATGQIQTKQTGETTLKLKECHLINGLCKTGTVTGEVVMPLSIRLVYLNRATHTMALLYSLGSGLPMTCHGASYKLTGSFLAPISVSNSLHTEYVLSLSQAGGTQSPNQYENEAGESVGSQMELELVGLWHEKVGWRVSQTLKFEELVEFKG